MKRLNFKAASAIVFGLSFSASLPTYAAAYDVSQADFDAAIGGTVTKNITCADASTCVGEGDYTLTEDVDITATNTVFSLSGDSSLDLGGNTFAGGISTETGANVTVENGTITGGNIAPNGAENFTLSEITAEDAPITPTASVVNIESGSYTAMADYQSVIDTSDWASAGGNSTINITGGTFRAAGAGAPTIMAHNGNENSEITLNITGGTFISDNFVPLDFNNFEEPEYGISAGVLNANISGGTFTGRNAAIYIDVPELNNIQLSGGTYNYTDTETEGNGAIVAGDGNPDSITNLLAPGYHFTNANITTVELGGMGGGGTVAVLVGDTEVITDGSEESSNSGLKAPDTGVFTREAANGAAVNTTFIVIMVAAALGLLGYKKFAHKK